MADGDVRGIGVRMGAGECCLAQSFDKLVYADFEQVVDGRAVSARGGAMHLFGYSENPTRLPTFAGAASVDPPAPELVRIKADDPNRLGKVDFEC